MLKSRLSEEATLAWVDYGFEAQRTTSAPASRRAIIRLAVSLVTWRHAETRRPFSGCSLMKRLRMICNTGICCCAHSILRLPASASEISFISPFFSSAIATDLLLFELLKFANEKVKCGPSAADGKFGGRAGSLAQSVGTIGFFPGKTGALAAKMTVGCGVLVNWTAQIESFDDGLGSELKSFAHDFGDSFFGNGRGAEAVYHYRDGFRYADCVGE